MSAEAVEAGGTLTYVVAAPTPATKRKTATVTINVRAALWKARSNLQPDKLNQACKSKASLRRPLAPSGTMANADGDHVRAARLLLESLTVRDELGDEAGLAECLEGLATAAVATRAHARAAALLGAASARRQASGATPPPAEDREIRALTNAVRAGMEPADFVLASEYGRALSSEAGVDNGDDEIHLLFALVY